MTPEVRVDWWARLLTVEKVPEWTSGTQQPTLHVESGGCCDANCLILAALSLTRSNVLSPTCAPIQDPYLNRTERRKIIEDFKTASTMTFPVKLSALVCSRPCVVNSNLGTRMHDMMTRPGTAKACFGRPMHDMKVTGVTHLHSIIGRGHACVHLQVPAPEQHSAQWPTSAQASTSMITYVLPSGGAGSPTLIDEHNPISADRHESSGEWPAMPAMLR